MYEGSRELFTPRSFPTLSEVKIAHLVLESQFLCRISQLHT